MERKNVIVKRAHLLKWKTQSIAMICIECIDVLIGDICKEKKGELKKIQNLHFVVEEPVLKVCIRKPDQK